MLCPRCGTNVGDKTRLCDRCLATERSDRLLGDGESLVDNPAKLGGPAQPASCGFDMGRSDSARFETKRFLVRLMLLAVGSFTLVLLVIFLSGTNIVENPVCFRDLWGKLVSGDLIQRDDENFKHIVIRSSASPAVGSEKANALFGMDGRDYVLDCEPPLWSEKEDSLSVTCRSRDDVPASFSDNIEVRLRFVFAKGSEKFSRRAIKVYYVGLHSASEQVEVERLVGTHLAEPGELRGFSGALREGEVVRGMVQGNAVKEIRGTARKLFWRISFSGVLQFVKA